LFKNGNCYAFKDNKLYEYIVDHSIGVAECIRNRWECKAISRKLSKIVGTSEKLIEDLLIFAGAFHDIGKLDKIFQMECESDGCTNFPGHYITSALILTGAYNMSLQNSVDKKYLENLIMGRIKERSNFKYLYFLLVVYPVILHHYAQVYSISSYGKFVQDFELYKKCTNDLSLIVKWIINNIVDERLKIIARNIMAPNVFEYIVHVHDIVLRLGYLKTLSFEKIVIEAATGLLNLCDGIVAKKARRRQK